MASYNKYFVIFLVSFVSLFYFVNSSIADVHYVSPTGTASWEECASINTPCSILTINQNITGGDTAIFLEGTYNLGPKPASGCSDDDIRPCNGEGTAENRIIFQAYPGASVTICSDGTNNRVGQTLGKDYITFDGFKFTHTVQSWPSDTSGAGPLIVFDGDYNIIENCEFVGTGWDDGTNSPAIYISSGSNNSIIRNNFIHGYFSQGSDNTVGIMAYGASNLIIENNTFENNNYAIYIKKKDEDLIVRNNLFKGSYSSILLHLKGGDAGNYQRRHKFYNNIAINSSIFFTMTDDFTATNPVDDLEFFNNTFYGNSIATIGWGTDREPTNVEYWNNLFVNNGRVITFTKGITYGNYNGEYGNVYISNSAQCTGITTLAQWQTCSGFDLNSNDNISNFVNPGGSNAEDYKRTSYPANGRGGIFASVMGAYITGNEVIGYVGEGLPDEPQHPENPRIQ